MAARKTASKSESGVTYTVLAKRTPLCKAGKRVQDAVLSLGPGEPLAAKVMISKNKILGRAALYVDEDKPDNVFAQLMSIRDNSGTEFDAADIQALQESGRYKIEINAADSKNGGFEGVLLLEEDRAKSAGSSEKEMKKAMEAADKAIAGGLVTKDEMDARLNYMCENDVDPILIRRVIDGYREFDIPVHQPSCLYRDPYLESSKKKNRPGIISRGLRSAVSRHAVLCEGDKSVGKNVYVETITWLLGMPLYLVTFTRQMSPASLYGDRTTDNTAMDALRAFDSSSLKEARDAVAKRDFASLYYSRFKITGNGDEQRARIGHVVSGMLTPDENDAMRREAEFEKLRAQAASVNIVMEDSAFCDWLKTGGVMCFNEMNMAEANFFASFTNQLLDGTGHIFVPGRGDIEINRDCVLFGTQNADYQGTEEQNEATMSRFGCIEFPQPETIKAQLVEAVGRALARDGYKPGEGLTRTHYNQVEDFYHHCLGSVRKGQVSGACLNIRGFVRALVEVAESSGYASLLDSIEMHVINTCPSDERAGLKQPLRTIVTL